MSSKERSLTSFPPKRELWICTYISCNTIVAFREDYLPCALEGHTARKATVQEVVGAVREGWYTEQVNPHKILLPHYETRDRTTS